MQLNSNSLLSFHVVMFSAEAVANARRYPPETLEA
jgi:hypothetical protein